MPKFRKKPLEIEAVQYTGDNFFEIARFMGLDLSGDNILHMSDRPVIHTLEGNLTARVGDWIIRGVAGEFYPCRQSIFEATYDAV